MSMGGIAWYIIECAGGWSSSKEGNATLANHYMPPVQAQAIKVLSGYDKDTSNEAQKEQHLRNELDIKTDLPGLYTKVMTMLVPKFVEFMAAHENDTASARR